MYILNFFDILGCEYCGKWFSTKQNLSVHVRDIHANSGQPISCSLCGKTCKSVSALRMHKRRYCLMQENILMQWAKIHFLIKKNLIFQICSAHTASKSSLEKTILETIFGMFMKTLEKYSAAPSVEKTVKVKVLYECIIEFIINYHIKCQVIQIYMSLFNSMIL